MAIRREELNPYKYPESPEQKANLDKLLEKLQAIRQDWAKPMIITSGLRSLDDQKKIDARRIVGGKPAGPRKSQHLLGNAADVSDPAHELWNWLAENNCARAIKYGVYLEDKSFTSRWCHIQSVPPKSGNRIFLP